MTEAVKRPKDMIGKRSRLYRQKYLCYTMGYRFCIGLKDPYSKNSIVNTYAP